MGNRSKREREAKLKAMSESERREFLANEERAQRQWEEDCKNFPELMSFMYDSGVDAGERRLGISPLSTEARDYIRKRFQNGEYPERLHGLVRMELDLKERE